MFYVPLTTTPAGWLVLGLGYYALYKVGKKRGIKEAEEDSAAMLFSEVPESDQTDNTKADQAKGEE